MDLFRDLLGLLRRGRLAAVVRFAHPRLATLEVGAALGANADELDLHALGLERSDALLSLLDRRRVVGPAEPAVAGDADETDLLAQNSSINLYQILAKILNSQSCQNVPQTSEGSFSDVSKPSFAKFLTEFFTPAEAAAPGDALRRGPSSPGGPRGAGCRGLRSSRAAAGPRGCARGSPRRAATSGGARKG